MNNDMKVIGVFAHKEMEALCIEEDSCLIAGSLEEMCKYLKEEELNKNEFQIKKVRYGEIREGLEMGASYSFDEESYSRFYPLGQKDKIELKLWVKEELEKEERKFMTIRVVENDASSEIKEEFVIDGYITKHKYVEEFGYPIKETDYLNIELINLAGHIIDEYGILKRKELEKLLIEISEELRGIEKQIVEMMEEERELTGKEELNIEEDEEGEYFVDFKEYGVQIDLLPKKLTKETILNNWYISMGLVFVMGTQIKLAKALQDEEKAAGISMRVFMEIMDYISDNCYGICNHRCIRNIEKSGYCRVCQMGEDRLQCPKYGEISYKKIKATEADMDEH